MRYNDIDRKAEKKERQKNIGKRERQYENDRKKDSRKREKMKATESLKDSNTHCQSQIEECEEECRSIY